MKKWMILCCLTGVLCGLSSCSSYYYSTLSSNDRMGAYDMNNDFVVENDSVCIVYSFYGEEAPVSVVIENKLDEPLFVDWQRSALIINGKAISYFQDAAPIQGVTESSSTGSVGSNGSVSSSSYGSFAGEIQLPRGIEFVPPRSRIESSTLKLTQLVYGKMLDKELIDQDYEQLDGMKVKTFAERNSPLRFRSYLSLFTGGESEKDRRYSNIETSFYLSELIKAGNIGPSSFQAWRRKEGNFFYNTDYLSRRTGIIIGSAVLATVGIVGIVLLATHKPTLDPHF